MFSRYFSGTYANQWIIVDMKHFTPGKGADDADFLWISEQLPGFNTMQDVTKVVKAQGNYWPSYNVPFDKSVYILSGYQTAFETYGDKYSYDNTSRALMMRRDHSSVQTLSAMCNEMRQNNYRADEYNPDQDPYLAVSSRKDLRTENAGLTGAIDAKVSSYSRVAASVTGAVRTALLAEENVSGPVTLFATMKKMHRNRNVTQQHYAPAMENRLTGTTMAVSGPTHYNADLPVFSWSTANSTLVHLGQPDVFDFDFIQIDFYAY
jgi:hypothetical protein